MCCALLFGRVRTWHTLPFLIATRQRAYRVVLAVAIALVILHGDFARAAAQSSDASPTLLSPPFVPNHVADTDRLDQMQQLLLHVDAQAKRLSVGLSLANTTVGAANVVGGAFAAKHHAIGPAIGAFVGAGFAIGTGLAGFTLGRAPFRHIYEQFLARRDTMPAALAIAQTERLWQAEAKAVGRFRVLSGGVLTGVGASMVAFSTAALIANMQLPSKGANANSRASLQGALLGLSGLLFVNGVTLLVTPDPIESNWQAYTLMRTVPTPPRTSLQLTPVRRGVAVSMALHF